jgi:NAD-dependent SIR2 family protein deacetylase
MMTSHQCVQCGHVYEFYREHTLQPDCPKCGASGGVAPPIVWPVYHEGNRIFEEQCGCRYDIVTGLTTYRCLEHREEER